MKPLGWYWILLVGLCTLSGCRSDFPTSSTDGVASTSSPITLSPDGKTIWVVNPDADSVTAIDASSLQARPSIPVGGEPWSVAVTPSGTVVVMNRRAGSLSLLEGGWRTDLSVGPELGGLALSPSGRFAYVTVSSADEVAVVDLARREVIDHIPVGRLPWAIAVTDDGDADDDDEMVVVTHRLARLRPEGKEATNDGKEGWLTLLKGETKQEIVVLPYEFGFPNALEGLAVLGERVYLSHLLNRPEEPRDFQNTVSGALSALSLNSLSELTGLHIHINESTFSTPVSFPRAVAVAPDSRSAYLVLAGTDAVMGIDLSWPEKAKLMGFWPTGRNPRGLVLNHEGTKAYVMNYLSRDVSVLDLIDTSARREIARIPVTSETLEPEILRGKILFNNASDPRLSHLGWVSCASCHYDGGVDGTTWRTPEGARQTMPLWNLEGTAPFHISATRDEIQDFEEDIEAFMRGIGLASGPAERLLGTPNGGRSADLDALATFVLGGIRVPNSAKGDEARISRGREVFERAGCTECHRGPAWTVSSLPGSVGTLAPNSELEVKQVLRDVGTYDSETDILGLNGFDVPTLLGLHATAPYLHNGQARQLTDVLINPRHAKTLLTVQQKEDIEVFLGSIDESTSPFPP